MKYTITINQKAIVELGFQDKLDFIDLAIFDFITDFMLCEDCKKMNVGNEQYFWIKADLIIENLPLLGITTTRGINKRIDKLVDCALLERCPDNQVLHQSFYKAGKNYKKYTFFTWNENSKPAWNESSDNNNKQDNNNNKQDKEKEIQKKKKGYTQEFEEAWKLYNRKGGKQEAFKRWCALTDKEKELALAHIPFYMQSNDIQFLKDFEGYLNKKYFLRVVRDKKGNTLYDPDQQTDNTYHPITGGALMWNDYYKCYLYTGWYFDGDKMYDGYDDDKRPDGAQIVLNNGRGTLTWNKEQQKWIKK